jgi:electron-transferring-flavoprotein dehydrogenase
MDPRALTELLPNRKEDGAPLNAPVSEDRFLILSETGATSVFLSNTNHEEDRPCHLRLKMLPCPSASTWPSTTPPEQRYFPAGVYEILGREEGKPRLQINAQNCVHCRTCNIKDPTQKINWVAPQGGEGPT